MTGSRQIKIDDNIYTSVIDTTLKNVGADKDSMRVVSFEVIENLFSLELVHLRVNTRRRVATFLELIIQDHCTHSRAYKNYSLADCKGLEHGVERTDLGRELKYFTKNFKRYLLSKKKS